MKAAFKKLIKEEGQEKASELIWCYTLIFHPDSALGTLDVDDKVKIVQKDYLDDGFTVEAYKDYIEVYKRICLTKKEKILVNWELKFDERNAFMASIPYNEETFELLDKMMSATEKLWKQYMTCLKDVAKEKEEGQTRGGAVESLAELGKI